MFCHGHWPLEIFLIPDLTNMLTCDLSPGSSGIYSDMCLGTGSTAIGGDVSTMIMLFDAIAEGGSMVTSIVRTASRGRRATWQILTYAAETLIWHGKENLETACNCSKTAGGHIYISCDWRTEFSIVSSSQVFSSNALHLSLDIFRRSSCPQDGWLWPHCTNRVLALSTSWGVRCILGSLRGVWASKRKELSKLHFRGSSLAFSFPYLHKIVSTN